MAILAALSVALVYFIHFPIFPAVPYLEYDPADISILISTFAFGPLAGIGVTVVVAVVQGLTVSASGGLYGIIMHIIATSCNALAAGLFYRSHKTKKGALIAIILGALAHTLVMIPANLLVTPLFTGMPRASIVDLMPFIVGFNLIKTVINGGVTFIIYKSISKVLHKLDVK